jgi:hypothetical protein
MSGAAPEVEGEAILIPSIRIDAPPLHRRTAERSSRERLALAHVEHAAAADRLRRLHLAVEAARSESMAKFRVISACEAIVETARKEEPRRRAALLLGEEVEAAPDVDQAERNLIAARAADGEQRRLIAVLEQESGRQAFRHAAAQTALSDAIRDVLEVDEAFLALEVEFRRSQAWVEALAEAFRALERYLPQRAQFWDRQNPVLPSLVGVSPSAMVGEWLASIREGNTDEPFPALGVFTEVGEPEADFGEVEGEGAANGHDARGELDKAGGDGAEPGNGAAGS